VAGQRYLLASNILIRWVQPGDPGSATVVSAIDALILSKAELFYASQNLGEFWNAVTRPVNRNGYGFSPEGADRLARIFESQIEMLPDLPDVHREWRRILVDYGDSGVQVHDARLVAAMLVHGVTRILTFDAKDFSRFDKIEAVHPLKVI
jgi:predicted nucleic acid-binding protein